MTDCPTSEYHKQRAQLWRDEAYRLAGHPLPRKEKSMTHEEQIAKLTEMLEIQQKLHETAIDMLKPAIEIAVQKEREACATMSDWILKEGGGTWGDAIRARGENK